MAADVAEGRDKLNCSTWNRLSTKERVDAMHRSWKDVKEGDMPLWFYFPAHPDARPTPSDMALLRAWSLSAGPDARDR